ncbi:MAG: endo-1,3-alpha-glucanase family glycosylhydrolase [Anaerolineae bacterium]
MAFYYAWYDESTWTSGITADTPLQPYRSSDVATIERHVSQAQAAGIDALVQSWYGPQETNNQTETNLRTLLDVAASRGFHAAVAFETNSPFFPDQVSVIEALHYLLTVHTQHPAYLRYRGRPVIFFWRQQRFSVDTWNAIRAEVDPDHTGLWIAEGTDLSYQRVFDGHYLYSIAWSPNVAHTLQDWGQRVQRYATDHSVRRFWVATVMPGYDDTRSGRAKAFAVDRRSGEYYRATWSAAIASQPDWVVITSFNEWVEGTMIEPSARYGDLYLNLTRELIAQFKGALDTKAAMPASEVVIREMPSPTAAFDAEAVESGPYVRANETVRIRSGPGITYPRIGRLARGEQARVLGRNSETTWWQIEVPRNGTPGWVSAAFVELLGDASILPVVEMPTATSQATLEVSAATPAATYYVVRSTATRTPTLTRTPTVGAVAVIIPTPITTIARYVTPLPRSTLSAQRQTVNETSDATVPPFITPQGVSMMTPSSNTTDIPLVTLSPRPSEPLAETKSPTITGPSPIATASSRRDVLLPSATPPLGGNSSIEIVAVRQPRETMESPLLWVGSVALLAALILLTVLFVRIRMRRHSRGNNRLVR